MAFKKKTNPRLFCSSSSQRRGEELFFAPSRGRREEEQKVHVWVVFCFKCLEVGKKSGTVWEEKKEERGKKHFVFLFRSKQLFLFKKVRTQILPLRAAVRALALLRSAVAERDCLGRDGGWKGGGERKKGGNVLSSLLLFLLLLLLA